jgi:ATP-dependent protease ClpP protease subunit
MSKIVAVDYDETLTTGKCYPGAGILNEEAIETLKGFRDEGICLILWTCRSGDELQLAIDKCRDAGLEFDAVNENTQDQIAEWGEDKELSPKLYADYYIDDKGMSCKDWKEIKNKIAGEGNEKEVKNLKKFWKIKNVADDEAVEMMIYGEISDETWLGDEVTPQQFAEDLKQCGGKALNVHVNSPGGDVFAAQAIYNQLKSYPGNVTMNIDGMCASAATIITCAGDKVVMPENAVYMIHNPKAAAMGYYDTNDLQKMANSLDVTKQTITNVYCKKCKDALSENKIKKMMDDETWMSAQDALKNGFIDEINDACKVKNSIAGDKITMNSVTVSMKRFKNSAKLQEIIAKNGKKTMEEGEKMSEKTDEKNIIDRLKDLISGMEGKPRNNTATPPIDAVQQERQRMIDLDALDDKSNQTISRIIDAAKKNGTTAEAVKPFIDAAKGEKSQENVVDAIKAIIQDQAESGAAGVQPMPADNKGPQAQAAEKMRQRDELVTMINKMRGEK